MENTPNQTTAAPWGQDSQGKPVTQEQLLREIYENTRKTRQYMKWSLYITVAFVVLPLLGAIVIVPFALSSLGNYYGAATSVLQQ